MKKIIVKLKQNYNGDQIIKKYYSGNQTITS